MVHTLPDYTSKWKNKTLFNIVDNGELAARLGSIATYDRRGNVLWMDNFEGAVSKWHHTEGGTGAEVALMASRPHSGSQCMKIGTGDTADDISSIKKRFRSLPSDRYGVEAHVLYISGSTMTNLLLWIYNGAQYREAELRFTHASRDLAIKEGDGIFRPIARGLLTNTDIQGYLAMKLVIDASTWKYVRAIFNDVEYDISTESIHAVNSLEGISIEGGVEIIANTNVKAVVYVDGFVLTQNEF